MTISNIQKRGAAGEDEGKRGVWYGEGGRWGDVGWGDGWMGRWVDGWMGEVGEVGEVGCA